MMASDAHCSLFRAVPRLDRHSAEMVRRLCQYEQRRIHVVLSASVILCSMLLRSSFFRMNVCVARQNRIKLLYMHFNIIIIITILYNVM